MLHALPRLLPGLTPALSGCAAARLPVLAVLAVLAVLGIIFTDPLHRMH
ncbi:hypothetical protein [Paragemmobacter ruber]|uniref:Uncharacterized protein n=1 Tax=Paragemmobacter ruber TaxID=1985673 RepID=A0ABW9Y3E6_9RHOB|nr:hypothetical protein [Rhodobacter ruber]NBE07014.1 hypothetical protein [Rhodobacter ruber]